MNCLPTTITTIDRPWIALKSKQYTQSFTLLDSLSLSFSLSLSLSLLLICSLYHPHSLLHQFNHCFSSFSFLSYEVNKFLLKCFFLYRTVNTSSCCLLFSFWCVYVCIFIYVVDKLFYCFCWIVSKIMLKYT